MNIDTQHHLHSITSIPNYDAPPAYTNIKEASYTEHGLIKILSGHETYHVINFSDVKKILGDKKCIRSPSNTIGGPSILPTLTPKDLLLNLDFPHHTRLKQFVSKDYSRNGLMWLTTFIEEIANIYIDDMLMKNDMDLFTDVLNKVSITSNCKLLGINIEDSHYFRSLSKTVQIADKKNVENLIEQFNMLYIYLMDHVQGNRQHSENGLIKKFINDREKSTPALNDEEITAILLGSLLGGDQNTLTVMTKILYAALMIPEIWSDMVKKPKSRELYIEELIRLTNLGNTSTFPRIATHDVEISSGVIPEGSVIYADVFLANRDPNIFSSPLEINPYRDGVRHLQFGYGMHNCMGQELARLEINAVINVLANRLPEMQLKSCSIPWSEGIILRRPDNLPIMTSL